MAQTEPAVAASPRPRDQTRIAAIRSDGHELTVEWADGRRSRFAAIWLLDNRPDGRHGPDGQRLFDAAELPEEPAIAGASLEDGIVHPTINLDRLDPECAIENLVANEPRAVGQVETILNMSFGMLGINSAVVVGRCR